MKKEELFKELIEVADALIDYIDAIPKEIDFQAAMPGIDRDWAELIVSEAKEKLKERWGCHCDLCDGEEPDECVIDIDRRNDCVYAQRGIKKEECEYWRKIIG